MLEEPAYESFDKGQVTPIKVTPYNPNHCSPCASTNSMKDLKLPGYDPNIQYDSEFYNMFISNQHLIEEVEKNADERNRILTKIFHIKDFYDKNANDIKAKRYKNGRKIHERKCNDQLEKTEECPYEGCDKNYACEGSLNLHMKTKHNGGNKTDREKLAKRLIRTTKTRQGYKFPDNLEVNLPPGII
jgi:hypothetical protein